MNEEPKLSVFLLQSVLKVLPSLVSYIDREYKYIYVNPAYEKWFNFSTQHFIGKRISEIAGLPAFEILKPYLDSALAGEEQKFSGEVPYKNGIKYLDAQYIPDRGENGSIRGVVVIAHDRTELVKHEQSLKNEKLKNIQNDKLATLGSMLACIAHEINNPLAVISSSASLMEQYKLDPDAIDAKLKVIHRSTDRIIKIVSSLTRYTRSSANSVHKVELLNEIVKESFILIQPKAKKYGIQIEFNECHEIDSKILCDQIEIEQILINLMNNSIDAIKDHDEKWIKISINSDSAGLILTIQDSGKGIPINIQKNLFLPFFTTKPMGEGTGLGLAIVKEILVKHHADISINNENKNTTFEIRFSKRELQHAV